MKRYKTMPHVCAFFSSSAEQDRVLAEFTGEGIERGHRTIHTVAPNQCTEHAARLTAKRLVAAGKTGVIVTILCDGAEKYLSEHFWNDPDY